MKRKEKKKEKMHRVHLKLHQNNYVKINNNRRVKKLINKSLGTLLYYKKRRRKKENKCYTVIKLYFWKTRYLVPCCE